MNHVGEDEAKCREIKAGEPDPSTRGKKKLFRPLLLCFVLDGVHYTLNNFPQLSRASTVFPHVPP